MGRFVCGAGMSADAKLQAFLREALAGLAFTVLNSGYAGRQYPSTHTRSRMCS